MQQGVQFFRLGPSGFDRRTEGVVAFGPGWQRLRPAQVDRRDHLVQVTGLHRQIVAPALQSLGARRQFYQQLAGLAESAPSGSPPFGQMLGIGQCQANRELFALLANNRFQGRQVNRHPAQDLVAAQVGRGHHVNLGINCQLTRLNSVKGMECAIDDEAAAKGGEPEAVADALEPAGDLDLGRPLQHGD